MRIKGYAVMTFVLCSAVKRALTPMLLNGVAGVANTNIRSWPSQQTRTYAKKVKGKKGKGPAVVELVEGEKDVINFDKLEGSMVAALNSLKQEFTTSVTARITPASLDKVIVKIEGSSYPLRNIAQLGMPNPQTITINMSAYPQSMNELVTAIKDTNLGLSPLVEKNTVKIPIPKMTGELREKLAKLAKSHAEKAKVGVRKTRQKGMAELKGLESVSEDTIHRLEKYLQQRTDSYINSIDEVLAAKSSELTKS